MQTKTNLKPKKKKFEVPHVYIILFGFIILMSILTYLIPTGAYNRIQGPEGRMIVDPNSYHAIARTPVKLLQLFVALPQGFVDAGWIVVLTFCVGGAFGVINKTGILEISISNLAKRFSNKGILVIPLFMTTFAMIDCFIGMPELCMVYIPIIMPLIIGLGFDSITAAAVALLGSCAGFTAALTNPFTIGIAQKIAGIPLYSGIQFRIVTLAVTLSVGIIFVLRYAMKIKKNPELSQVYIEDTIKREKFTAKAGISLKATTRQKLSGISILVIFFYTIFGVLKYKWDLPEMGGMFIAMAVISGVFAGMNGRDICDAFTEGCKDVLVGALVIGIARGVTVVMTDGQIMDSIVHSIAMLVQQLPSSITAIGMLISTSLFNGVIGSGSGKAVVLMPILAPLADVVGLTRQTAILAYQYGDGITNVFWPTSGYFMASIAIAGVSWPKFAKFYWKLALIWTGLGALFIFIAQAIKLA